MAEQAQEVDLDWDPYRTIFGLGRIGYTPPSALGDIIDNSVRAEAKNVSVHIIKLHSSSNNGRKNNVREYIVCDDGLGMNERELQNALKIGSSDANYEDHSLSKFGLGLKAAAFSQGATLEILSSDQTVPGSFIKYVVSLDQIKEKGKYFASKVPLNDEDNDFIRTHLPSNKGTVIRIKDVHQENHPSVKETIDQLKYRLGVIYYYFLEDGLSITIVNGNERYDIEPFDVLFTTEAQDNLDENSWDGKTVNWIKRSEDIVLDKDYNVTANIEVTQLPHPPTFKPGDAGIREKYKIEANNYGYYVYRNKRLIAWTQRFNGIIPMDQDLYSFRGRLNIDDRADNAFNIDVKKSSIILSDEAFKNLSDLSADYKRKSKRAWGHAKSLLKQKQGQEPSVVSNRIVDDIDVPDVPGEPPLTEEEELSVSAREQDVANKMKENIRKQAAEDLKEKSGEEIEPENLTIEQIEETLKGSSHPEVKRIFRVSSIVDNLLWEPYYDAEHGHCVRINKNHRFAKVVYEDNSANIDLQIIFDILLLYFSLGEAKARTSPIFKGKDVEYNLSEFRRVVSEFLADLCRKKEGKLPPVGRDD